MSILGNISAGFKVSLDKIINMFNFNGTHQTVNQTDQQNDSLQQFNDVLNPDNYNSEATNARILDEVSFTQQYSYFFDEPTHIIDNLYLGSAYNAASYDVLNKHNIKIIMNMTKEISNYYPDDFTYIHYGLNDDNNERIIQYLESSYQDILNNPNDNILIHCYMGASRSASIVIYYLVVKRNMTFDNAIEFIKEKRPIVNLTFRLTKDLAESISEKEFVNSCFNTKCPMEDNPQDEQRNGCS